jgi:hypothetical protein
LYYLGMGGVGLEDVVLVTEKATASSRAAVSSKFNRRFRFSGVFPSLNPLSLKP